MKKIDSLIKQCGKKITVVYKNDDDGIETECIIQPLRYKNKMYLEGTPTDIGVNNAGYYLIIAPSNFEIGDYDNIDYLTDKEKKYHIDCAEKICYKNKTVYNWIVVKTVSNGDFPYYDHWRK